MAAHVVLDIALDAVERFPGRNAIRPIRGDPQIASPRELAFPDDAANDGFNPALGTPPRPFGGIARQRIDLAHEMGEFHSPRIHFLRCFSNAVPPSRQLRECASQFNRAFEQAIVLGKQRLDEVP